MKVKNLRFTYENACNFIVWLTRFYRNKYQVASITELDGLPINDIAQERWDSAMAKTSFILGVTGKQSSENSDKQQLLLNFEEYILDSDCDGWTLSQDVEPISGELFERYINQCVFAQ